MGATRILEPSGSNGSIQINNDGEFDHSDDLFFDIDNTRLGIGTNTPESAFHLVGDAKIDGILTVTEFKTNVVTTLHQEGSSEFGDTADDTHTFTGPGLFTTGLSGSLTSLTDGSAYITAGDGVTISTGSNGAIEIAATHTVDGSTVIGPSEDGTYEDGLFADLTPTSQTGTVVDRFNEILKALAPSPAPSVGNIGSNTNGQACRLTYDPLNLLDGYTIVGTTTGFVSSAVNSVFTNSAAGQNIRKGVFDNNTSITGDINESTTSDTHTSGEDNYPNNSFGNADKGTLKLVVNGAVVHEIELNDLFLGTGLPGSGTDVSLNASGSGFTHVSETSAGKFADGTELDLFQHRTARYVIHPNDQRLGWNVAKVQHVIDSTTNETNSVEWLVDDNTDAITMTASTITGTSLTGLKKLSGVSYYTGGTATYSVDISNAYSNVYSADNWITFSTLNCSSNLFALPEIDTASGESQDKIINLSTTMTINEEKLLNESIALAVNVTHPLKSNIVSGAQAGVAGILLYNKSETSSETSEDFTGESYRMIEHDYNSQTDISASNYWDSSISLVSNSGMIAYDESMRSPINSINSDGNFSVIANGPAGNVDYSSITGTRTYYRRLKNTSGGSQSDLSISLNGIGTIVQHGSSYGTSGLSITAKIPTTTAAQSTGWLDLSQPFATGQYADADGCLQGALDSTLNSTNIITFGTKFINHGEHIIIKIETDASYTGQIDSITVDWG